MSASAKYAYERYYEMPKEFVGPQNADELFHLYENLSRNEKSFGYLYTAGSAAVESGLLAYEATSEERHRRINAGREVWVKAQDSFIFRHISKGWSEARLMCIPDKIQIQLAYIDIYHEMVEGYIEESTIVKLHATLVDMASTNKALHDQAETAQDWTAVVTRRGIGYEVGTLLTVTRLGCPSFFAIPATARADHGGSMKDDTHDVRLIQQKFGKINWCVPFEVKPTSHYSERYKAAYISGRAELHVSSSINPLDLINYMAAELQGSITASELEELDNITSRVLSRARDYRAREEYELFEQEIA